MIAHAIPPDACEIGMKSLPEAAGVCLSRYPLIQIGQNFLLSRVIELLQFL
jgi:hypothetical protein